MSFWGSVRRRGKTIAIGGVTLGALIAAPLAIGSGAGHAHSKPAPAGSLHVVLPRLMTSGGRRGAASLPGVGARPQVLSPRAYRALLRAMGKPRGQAPPAPASRRAHGTFAHLIGSASTGRGHAYWNGSRWVAPPGVTTRVPRFLPRLLIPAHPGGKGGGRGPIGAFPSALYGSTQVDSATSSCSDPRPNEPSVAQSSDNPNDVVVAAQAYVDSTGACDDSHAWVFYSHDGGQHWKEEVIPGLTSGLASGDVGVVYDPKDHVFVYSFLQFSRTTSTDSVNVESSSDGASWFDFTTLDSAPGALDKVMITVNQDPSSTNYGRVLVAWRDDSVGQNAFIDAFSDDGGGSWTSTGNSINTVPDCGNGVSPAFDANGDAMAAWWDCNGGSSEDEELSSDGGAHWTQPNNTKISAVTDIGSSGPSGACGLNNGGSAFRCDSFPSLAGDPNSSDAGGTAFFVVFATWESTTQSSVTANVSQLHGLSTTDGGTTWNGGGGFSFNYIAFKDFGDKFFPWAAFSPNGRLNVGYSDREASASSTNPNGLSYNEGQAEASSLTALRADSYIAYTADGTLGNPGTLTFIGDYAGIESQDNNFDTAPVWTDVRNGNLDVRTMDLCYADCPTFLQPEAPLAVSRSAGSSFTDLYQFNTDSAFGGAGGDFWNAVGIREGADGSSVDDDIGLWNSRYFSTRVALGSFGPPFNDYVLENDNAGHGPTQPYFVDVHNFSTNGGPYTVEWAHGHIVLGTSFADSMAASNVIRVYDMSDSTGTTYYVGLRPAAGNTSNYRISLHLYGNGAYQGSSQESATSGNTAPGSPAFASVNTGASPTGFDALVVQNNNGGSGSYTLYRDTKAPSGKISIDGGAAVTGSATLHLTLSATNPTPGDPVSDMAFSVNGGAFGAFHPYATSATVSGSGHGMQTVSVKYRNGAGGTSVVSDTIWLGAPAVSSLNPKAGSTAGGNTVIINGGGFVSGVTAKFGSTGSSLPTTFVSGGQIKVVAPAHSAGTVDVFVTNPEGTSTAAIGDLYAFGPPTVTSVSPRAGSTAGGNTVAINGTGFVPGVIAKFGGASVTTTFVSGTQIKAVVPAHSAGTVDVLVTSPAGTSTAGSGDVYAFGAPKVTSVAPNAGSTAGGNTVTINGTGFVPGATAKFGTSSVTTTFVSGTQLKAVAPAHAAGTVSVLVSTTAGTSTAVNGDLYAYGAPTVTSIAPTSGPPAGGNTVTINGTGFVPGMKAKFGPSGSLLSVTFVSKTQVKVLAPSHAAGTVDVFVNTPAGTSAAVTGDKYTYT